MKRKKLLFGVGAVALFLVLLALLVWTERLSPDGSIRTFPLALWYSITTLTTVGYGDLYPVTVLGRVIGAVLQLMSLGVLAALIGALIALLRGKLIPMAKIRMRQNKEWFVFPSASQESMTLARALYEEDRDRAILFCTAKNERVGTFDAPPHILSPIGPVELARRKKDGRVSVFCMSEDFAENERLAAALKETNGSVYCMTEREPEQIPERLHVFDPYDCCARLYWRRFPICSENETVVIVGDGKYAEAILACGLELNVCSDRMHTVYRAYGNYEDFQRNHYQLSAFASLNALDPVRDSLFLNDAAWNAQPELLLGASRIIVCADDEKETYLRLTQLQRFFPISCPVHARLSQPLDGIDTFGSREELFAPELVVRSALYETAIRMHEIYRRSAGSEVRTWDALGSFLRRSNIASAEHLRLKIRILLGETLPDTEPLTPELCKRAYAVFKTAGEEQRDRYRRIEHARWMRFHFMNNWSYAAERDNTARRHPMLVPYEMLSVEDQQKDDYAWELLDQLS